MGKIIRNGIEYGGTYDSATSVNYDNSVSGLNARTVQEGIDELNESLPQSVLIETTAPDAVSKDKTVSYPNGYTLDNCFVVSVMRKISDDRWDTVPLTSSLNGLLISLRTSGIVLYTENDTSLLNKTLRIVFQKY